MDSSKARENAGIVPGIENAKRVVDFSKSVYQNTIDIIDAKIEKDSLAKKESLSHKFGKLTKSGITETQINDLCHYYQAKGYDVSFGVDIDKKFCINISWGIKK